MRGLDYTGDRREPPVQFRAWLRNALCDEVIAAIRSAAETSGVMQVAAPELGKLAR
jgi:hypothetical protein